MKRIFILLACICSFSTFAADLHSNCPQAVPTDDANFCPSFKSVAECHCVESGLPKAACQNMNNLYLMMLARFKTLQKACEYQKDTTTQICIDDWNCYRQGGNDSQGRQCSSTGKVCS